MHISFVAVTIYLRKGDSQSASLDLVGMSQVLRLHWQETRATNCSKNSPSQQTTQTVIQQTPHHRIAHETHLFASE